MRGRFDELTLMENSRWRGKARRFTTNFRNFQRRGWRVDGALSCACAAMICWLIKSAKGTFALRAASNEADSVRRRMSLS